MLPTGCWKARYVGNHQSSSDSDADLRVKNREKLSPQERKYWFNVIEADKNSGNKHSNAKKMKQLAKKRARDSEDSKESD